MSDVKLTNIPCLNVGRVVEKLAQAYSAVIKKPASHQNNALRYALGAARCR